MTDKSTYYKLTVEHSQDYVILDKSQLAEWIEDFLDGANRGIKISVEIVLMTDEDFDKLPQFEGF